MNISEKPRVFFYLDNMKMGGVMKTLQSSIASRLSEQFEFEKDCQLYIPEIAWNGIAANLIVIKRASSWKKLPSLLALKFLKRKSPIIIHEHHYSEGFERAKVPSMQRFRLMLKLAYSCADRVVAVSHAQGEWLCKNKTLPREKLSVIQQSPNLDAFLKVPQKIPGNPLVLGAYGRFSEQKGFDVLIEAMKRVEGDRFKLYIGGAGPEEDRLKQLAKGQDNIEFVGRIDDVPAFLERCDAVVIPSRWEPWGNVCLEAKAAGKPTIASDIDGLSEQVQDCGILVPAEDPQQLATAIASLNDCDLIAWGKNARHSVERAWETYLTEWENLLWQMLKASS